MQVLNYSLLMTTITGTILSKSKRIAKKRGGGWPAVRYSLKLGNLAMFYPEANAIVPAILDQKSKTPSFKRVVVTLNKV